MTDSEFVPYSEWREFIDKAGLRLARKHGLSTKEFIERGIIQTVLAIGDDGLVVLAGWRTVFNSSPDEETQGCPRT